MKARATSAGRLWPGIGALLALFGAPCLGAGAWITESGGADTGMAGAGRAALPLDAASQVANPATLALLPRSTVTVAAMPLAIDMEFRGSSTTPGHAEDRAGTQALGALYGAYPDGRIAYGLAAHSYFGLGFELGDDWVGRRAMERAGLVTFNLAPAAAFRLTDRLSVGASIAAQWAQYDFELAVANDSGYFGPPEGLADGRIKVDDSSWSVGGQIGLLYSVSDHLRLGSTWTAPVHHSFGANLHERGLHPVLQGLLPAEDALALDLTVPQQLSLGLAYGMTHGRVVSVGLAWQDWSALGDSTFSMPGLESAVFPAGLRDTWGASLGIRQPAGKDWMLAAGLAYESDPSPTTGVPVYFPVAEQWRVAAGAERRVGDACRLRVMLSLMGEGTAKVIAAPPPLPLPGIPPLNGAYPGSRLAVLGLALDFDL